MAAYHILSLDGGGIRGVLTASLLERLAEAYPAFLEEVDLIAGTSTGGILTLALASGMTPTEARELYERCGNLVFKDSLLDNIHDLGQLTGAQYSNKPLKTELSKQFGDMTLGELKKMVLVSSFELDNNETESGKVRTWKAKFFHNYPGLDSDGDQKVVDVALRTSAAPTFFPIYQGFIDGGVVANNPSMCALAQALEPTTGTQRLQDIRLLSVGTGRNPQFMTNESNDWGLLQWAPHLVSIMMDGSVGLADYQCMQALSNHYLRVNPILPVPISLDKVDQIPLLKGIEAKEDLSEAIRWVKRNFRAATPQKGALEKV